MSTSPLRFRPAFSIAALILALFPITSRAQDWIWSQREPSTAPVETLYFRHSFNLEAPVRKAVLIASGDDEVEIFINGKKVASSTAWQNPAKADMASVLKPGQNLVAARVLNRGSLGGLIARITLTLASGEQRTIDTGPAWTFATAEQPNWSTAEMLAGWPHAVALGKIGMAPWGDVFAAGTATPADRITVAKGFRVELLRTAEPGEGSWVAMALDRKGRLIVSPQEGISNLLRITLRGDGGVAGVETIPAAVGSAMGLLYADTSLYVSGRGPAGLALYRLKEGKGDVFNKPELIGKFEGAGGEHGSHALVAGPDRRIFYMHGNFVKVPATVSPRSPHRLYGEDQLLPRAEDGNGFGVGIKPPGGFLLRGSREGKNWELFAAGLRNTYDFAVNRDGEMFAFDSDMEWDWGTPWYRPTRIYHLVSGGDYGFREGTGKWPAHYPDGLPSVVDVGIGSPTGVKFGTGSRFPAKYQRALFAMDWSYGRIFAVHLRPEGASYGADVETFVQGKPLNVTDLEFGRDGAMYFITGGRGTQSGLYRVTYSGTALKAPVRDSREREAAKARSLRHKLEAFHGRADAKALAFLWPHLGSPDRYIRYAARIALEAQDVATWQGRALAEERPEAGLTALLALARVGPASSQAALLNGLARFPLETLSEAQKLEKLRIISLSFIRQGKPSEEMRKFAVAKLDRHFPSASPLLNRELARLLIYLEAPGVVEKVLALVDKAPTQEEQLDYIFNLRTLKNGWTLEQRERYFNWFHRDRSVAGHSAETRRWFKEAGRDYGDGASFPKFLSNIRSEAVATLNDSERAALALVIVGQAKTATRVAARAFVKEWTVEELVASLPQVSAGRSFEKGRDAYAAAQCASCHRVGNEGGAIGPDLTAVASRFSRRDILESILLPSKVVSEQYQNTTVVRKDGEEVTGRIVEETAEKLVLLVEPISQVKVEVRKSEVARREVAKLSPMPEGLVNVLSREEILDLIAFLEAGGKSEAAAFRKEK